MKRLLLLIGLLGLVAGLTAQDISSKNDPDKALLRELLPKLGKPDTRNQAIADLLEKGTTASVIQIAVNNIVSNSTGISDETKIQAFRQSHKHASVRCSESYLKLRSFVASHHDPRLNRLARSEEFFEQLYVLKFPNESLQQQRQSNALAGSTCPDANNSLFCTLLINIIEDSVGNPSEQHNGDKQAAIITEVLSMFNIMAETMDALEKQFIVRHIQQTSLHFFAHPNQRFLNFAPIYQALVQRYYGISEQHTATLEEILAHLLSANTEHDKNTLQFAIRCSLDASVTAKTKILVFEQAQLNADVLLSPAYEELRSYIEFNCNDHFLSHYAFYERSLKELLTILCASQGTDFQTGLAGNIAQSAQTSRRNDILSLLLRVIEKIEQMAQPSSCAAIVTVLTQAQQLASSMRDEELVLWRLHVNKLHARYQDDAAYGAPSVGEAYAALFTLLASAKPVGQDETIDQDEELYASIRMLVNDDSRDQGIRYILHNNDSGNFTLLIENSILSGVSPETRRELLQKVEAQKTIVESRELKKLRDLVKQEKAQAEHAAISAQTPTQEKPVAPEENVQKQKPVKKNKLPAAKKRKNQRNVEAAEMPVTPHDKPVFAQDLEEQLLMAPSTHEQTENQSAPQETNFTDSFSGLIQKLRQVHLATTNNTEAVSEIIQSNNVMQRFLQSSMEQPNVFMHMDVLAQQIQALPARDKAYLELSFANYATALSSTEDLSATIDIADIARQDDPRLWHYVTYLAARLGCISAQTSLAQFHTTRAQESPLIPVVANEYHYAQQWLNIAASSTERSDHPRKASVIFREIEPVRQQLCEVVNTRIMPLALHTFWQQQAMMHPLNPA